MSNNLKTILLLATIIISTWMLCKSCNPLKKGIVNHKAKDSIVEVIKTLEIHDTTNVFKWKIAKGKTDTVIQYVVMFAPDTCQTYIDTIIKAYDLEREQAQNTIYTKDSLLAQQKIMIRINEKFIEDEIAYSDSVIKSRESRYFRGFRDGFIIGGGLGLIVPKFIQK